MEVQKGKRTRRLEKGRMEEKAGKEKRKESYQFKICKTKGMKHCNRTGKCNHALTICNYVEYDKIWILMASGYHNAGNKKN